MSNPEPSAPSGELSVGRRRALPAAVILGSLALLVGLCLIGAPAEKLYGPGPVRGGGLGEELDRGNIASELRQGPLLAVLDYQWAPFFGGSLVMGIVAVPFFVLFGSNLFALKLAPLVFHALTVALLVTLLSRVVSRRAAWMGGLLMALCPPGYALMTTVCFGTHVEQNLFSILAVCLTVGLAEREAKPVARWAMAAWGVVLLLGGLSLTYTLRHLDLDNRGRFLETSAVSGKRLGEWFLRRYPGDLERLGHVVDGSREGRSLAWQREVYGAMGSLLDRFLGEAGPRHEYDRDHLPDYRRAREFLERRAPEEFRHLFAGEADRDGRRRGSRGRGESGP